MFKLRTLLAAATLSVALSATAFSADEPANLDYSRWTKTCRPDPGDGGHLACYTISSGRMVTAKDTDASAVSAVVIQHESDTGKVLRLFVPLGMQVSYGTRLLIDGQVKGQRSYVDCFREGCFADYPLDEAMFGLTTANTLAVQTINANGAPLSFPVPLTGFAPSFNGSASDPASLDQRDSKRIDAMLTLKPDVERADVSPTLRFRPWTKICLPGTTPNVKRVCFTGMDARSDVGASQIAVVAIDPDGDPKKLLRITVPLGEQLSSPVTLAVDDLPTSTAPYVVCLANGCMADTGLPDAMIAKLKGARRITVRFNNSAGRTIVRTIAMEDFGQAFDGPPIDPKVLQAGQKK